MGVDRVLGGHSRRTDPRGSCIEHRPSPRARVSAVDTMQIFRWPNTNLEVLLWGTVEGMDEKGSQVPDGGDGAAGAGRDASVAVRSMTVRGAAFLGVGSMVGAGIFALLGEAGAVAGSAVWVSFLLAGIVATLQGYAVAQLGARYPSSGGIVTFLLQAYGRGHTTAISSWLLYFAALIVTALVAVSFGRPQGLRSRQTTAAAALHSPVTIVQPAPDGTSVYL